MADAEIAKQLGENKLKTADVAAALNCKRFFNVYSRTLNGPLTQAQLVARFEKVKPGHEPTWRAYASWAKRADEPGRCPFGVRLHADGDKYAIKPRNNNKMG